jgi:hypothetical protein
MGKYVKWKNARQTIPFNGWCGVSTVKTIFNYCGIKVPLFVIAAYIWKWWYGSAYILMVAYLQKYFKTVSYKTNATTDDISKHLKAGHICIVNFYDVDEGHYAIIIDYAEKFFIVLDTSNERDAIYGLSKVKFKEIWYDYLADGICHEGLLIWVNPTSIKQKKVRRV